jgi:RNA polymerase sigma-70 factor (ECF subfamily)
MSPVMLESLFLENHSRLCYFAYKIVGNQALAKDIVQDCFIKCWHQCPYLSGESSMKAYLYQSVRNASLNALRHAEVEKRYASQEALKPEATSDHRLDLIIRSELLGEIHRAIEGLPPGCRQVLKLAYFDSLKNEEIAKALGISVNTVKTQKARALKLLQVKLSIPALYLFILTCY